MNSDRTRGPRSRLVPTESAAVGLAHRLRLLLAVLFVLAGAACQSPLAASGPPRASVPVPTAPPLDRPALTPVSFPRDDAPHSNLLEWWYYTGHLTGPAGERYGFEFVVFQSVRGLNPVGYAAHFAVTDHQTRAFHYQEQTSVGSQIGRTDGFDLSVGDWRMRGANGRDTLDADLPGYMLHLELEATKPAALHHDVGLVPFGPAGDSYYYSRTRLAARGNLRIGDRDLPVTGIAWMDHQWGDFISAGGGWDWYAVQLDDGTDLTLSVVKDDAGQVVYRYGTFVAADGRTTHLDASAFDTIATGRWTSPHSGATYPSGWIVTVADPPLNLRLEPVLLDQELVTTTSTGVTYWEGEVVVAGDRGASPVSGHGYVELNGYATPSPAR